MLNVDARGLQCPQPVVLAKKAMAQSKDIIVLVDNTTAQENIFRLASKEGFTVNEVKRSGEIISIHLIKMEIENYCDAVPTAEKTNFGGPTVVVISADKMGRGDDKLGNLLIKSFFHTLTEMDSSPDAVIFFNTGVKLANKNSEVIGDLQNLENRGVEIFVCGTCANYFEMTGDLGAGKISNMYDIADTMFKAGRIINP